MKIYTLCNGLYRIVSGIAPLLLALQMVCITNSLRLTGQSILKIENYTPMWSVDVSFTGFEDTHLLFMEEDLVRFDKNKDIYVLYNLFGKAVMEGYAIYKMDYENGVILWERINQSREVLKRAVAHSPKITDKGYEILVHYEYHEDTTDAYIWFGSYIGRVVYNLEDGSVVNTISPNPIDTLVDTLYITWGIPYGRYILDYARKGDGYYCYIGEYEYYSRDVHLRLKHINRDGHLDSQKVYSFKMKYPVQRILGGINDKGEAWFFGYAIKENHRGEIDTFDIRLYTFDEHLSLRTTYDFSDVEDITEDVVQFDIYRNTHSNNYFLISYSNKIPGSHKQDRVVVRKFSSSNTLIERIDLFNVMLNRYRPLVGLIDLGDESTLLYLINERRAKRELYFYLSNGKGELKHVRTLKFDANYIVFPVTVKLIPEERLLMGCTYKPVENLSDPTIPWNHAWFMMDLEDFLTHTNTIVQKTPLTLYPNPTTGKLFFSKEVHSLQLRLFSPDGKEMNVDNSLGFIDLTGHEAGTYILYIYENDILKEVKKIIKI